MKSVEAHRQAAERQQQLEAAAAAATSDHEAARGAAEARAAAAETRAEALQQQLDSALAAAQAACRERGLLRQHVETAEAKQQVGALGSYDMSSMYLCDAKLHRLW